MGKVLLVQLTSEHSYKTEDIDWNWIILTMDQKPGWKSCQHSLEQWSLSGIGTVFISYFFREK